jgi:hypothetical protein
MESEGLLPYFQKPATCSHTHPDESSLQRPTVFLADAFQCYQLHIAGRAMAHVVSRRPFTTELRVNSQAHFYGICGGEGGTVAYFLRVLRLSHVSIVPPMPHNHSFIRLPPTPYKVSE